jgi:transposase
MAIQRGLNKDSKLQKFILGAHPIIEHFVGLLRIGEIIGTYMRFDQRFKLEDQKVLTLLVHNILTTPYPLYEIGDWLQTLDVERLDVTSEQAGFVQDDRVGRALVRFYNCRHQDVFFQLALRAIKIFELNCSQVHHDTTTVTFAGKYPGWSAQELLTYGHNKDHRPDLKQLVLGLSVTADGAVPITHQVYDGNQTDDRLHPANHRRLQKLLQRVDFIYVADCKLATVENLCRISDWGGLFVSVMPRTWKEDENFRAKVRRGEITWKHILSRPNNRNPNSKIDRYWVAQGEYCTSQGFRLDWIRSSQKAEQDAETRQRHIEQALESLRALQPRLNAYNLKRRKQIIQAVRQILKKEQCHDLISYEIHATREYQQVHLQKGRPTDDTPCQLIWKNIFSLSFELNHKAVDLEEKTDGVFPLITNLDPKTHPPKRILEIYKFQPFLEKRHSQVKTYQEIAPAYLKNAERVVAFLHIQIMALMVATLIERQIRLAMRRQGIESLPIYPENRPCKAPTMFDIVRLFVGVERFEVSAEGKNMIFPAALTKTQNDVLKLLEVPVAAYQ